MSIVCHLYVISIEREFPLKKKIDKRRGFPLGITVFLFIGDKLIGSQFSVRNSDSYSCWELNLNFKLIFLVVSHKLLT